MDYGAYEAMSRIETKLDYIIQELDKAKSEEPKKDGPV